MKKLFIPLIILNAVCAGEPNSEFSNEMECVRTAYQHYMRKGHKTRRAWNNAIQDCSWGTDAPCLMVAYKHYAMLGHRDQVAWNNAVRGCRKLTPP